MSETVEHVEAETEGGAAPEVNDVEARARRMGWKPPEELRVQPRNGTLSAEEFLARGEADLPILRERLRSQDGQLVEQGRKLEQALDVVTKLSDRFRTVDQRAYERARADLAKERDAAIGNADVQEVRRLDKEINDLDKTAPVAEQARTTPTAAAQTINPEAAAWLADGNDWFTKYPDLAAEAQALHIGFQNSPTHKNLTLRQNLDKVTETIRKLYPDRFENARRNAPPAVSPSSASGAGRKVDPLGFDALPADAKREFERYSKMLNGKGKPLTKEEWAQSYHEGT